MSEAIDERVELVFPYDLSADGQRKVAQVIRDAAREAGYSEEDIQQSMISIVARLTIIADR